MFSQNFNCYSLAGSHQWHCKPVGGGYLCFFQYETACWSLTTGIKVSNNDKNVIKKKRKCTLVNLPYTHTGQCEDHSLSRVLSLLVSSCRGHRIPRVLNHMNLCHKSHSVAPRPRAYTHTVPPQAHRTGWGNPRGHSHMGCSRLGGTGSNNQTHSGHKKDLEGKNERGKRHLQRWWGEDRVGPAERNTKESELLTWSPTSI